MRTDYLDVARATPPPWHRLGSRQCLAHARSGQRCGRAPIPGGRVCVMHGGGALQTQAAAKMRLAAMAELAVNALNESRQKLEIIMSVGSASYGERIQAAVCLT